MNLTDEQLDALADRLYAAAVAGEGTDCMTAWDAAQHCAREAARWAAEQQGEVVWEAMEKDGGWRNTLGIKLAKACEEDGRPVRAIRVIATTTKEA